MSLTNEQQQAILDANATLSAENDALKERLWALTESTRLMASQAQTHILFRDATLASLLTHQGVQTATVPFKMGTKVQIEVERGQATITLQTEPPKVQVAAG